MGKQLRVTAASLTKQRKEGRSWDFLAQKYSVRKDTMLKYSRSKGVDTRKRYKAKPKRMKSAYRVTKSGHSIKHPNPVRIEFHESTTIEPLKIIYRANKHRLLSQQLEYMAEVTVYSNFGEAKEPETQPFIGTPISEIMAKPAKQAFYDKLANWADYIFDVGVAARAELRNPRYRMILRFNP